MSGNAKIEAGSCGKPTTTTGTITEIGGHHRHRCSPLGNRHLPGALPPLVSYSPIDARGVPVTAAGFVLRVPGVFFYQC